MIVRTMPYSLQEIVQILSIRAQVEGISVDEEAYAYLGEIGVRSTLRYAVQLLTPAKVVVQTNGRGGHQQGGHRGDRLALLRREGLGAPPAGAEGRLPAVGG